MIEALQAALAFSRDRMLIAQVKLGEGDMRAAAAEVKSAADSLQAALDALREELEEAA